MPERILIDAGKADKAARKLARDLRDVLGYSEDTAEKMADAVRRAVGKKADELYIPFDAVFEIEVYVHPKHKHNFEVESED